MGVKRMQRAKLAAAYLLLALAAALGWLYSCLPDRVYLEPGQALYLPRFAWVEPQRGHGSRNVASTRAVGSYQIPPRRPGFASVTGSSASGRPALRAMTP